MATTTKREILVLNRYEIKKDGKGLHKGDVVLHIRNDKGVEYYTTLRRNKRHSCNCPATVKCYHIKQMVERENARFDAEKAVKVAEQIVSAPVIEAPKVIKIDYRSAYTASFFGNLPSRQKDKRVA